MWRKKCQAAGLANRLSNKRDTPMKSALTRRDRRDKHRRPIPNKHHEAFPEESEVEDMDIKPTNQVWTQTSIKPVHCKSVLHSSSPAFTENPRDKAVIPATPANKGSSHQVSSGHPASKAGEMLVKKEQNLAGTPESVITSRTESDSTFSSDDASDDCCSSSPTTSSSLPSPEIFRKENYVETLTFPIEDDMLGLHHHIKNSTLLDVSHVEGISTHNPPNISTIIDTSTIISEKSSELSTHGVIDDEPKTHTDPFQSEKAFKRKKNTKPTIRRPISCKKKVWFKSPIIAEHFERKSISETKLTIHKESEPVHWSSPAKQIEPDVDTSRTDEINLKEDGSQQVTFFDFVSDGERDEFFQGERQRFSRLRSFFLFPLTAAKCTKP